MSAPPVEYDPDYKLIKLKSLAQQYEFKPESCAKIRQLEAFEIVIICDDSGSMASIVDDNTGDPFGKKKTRWDELCQTVSIVVEIAGTLDKNGVDVYFLNRAPLRNVSSASQIQVAFQYPPAGYTPTSRTIKQVLTEKEMVLREKKVLLILATDGEPTDDNGNVQIEDFKRVVKSKPKNVFMSVVACTDDDNAIEYLNKMDKKIERFDVVDDFRSEKKEIQKKQGKNFPFSFGDYVVKILLGSVDASMDSSDEKEKCVIS